MALLARCGAIPSTHDYHFNAFLAQAFPQGTAFPAYGPLPPAPDLPLADAKAFSIDDATTTEIDDAFSVSTLANGNTEIGIHIAAPALGVVPGSPAEQAGLKPGDIRRATTSLLSAIEVGFLFEDQKVFEVVVWGEPELRHSLTSVGDFFFLGFPQTLTYALDRDTTSAFAELQFRSIAEGRRR